MQKRQNTISSKKKQEFVEEEKQAFLSYKENEKVKHSTTTTGISSTTTTTDNNNTINTLPLSQLFYLLLPTFFQSILDIYIDNNLSKFYLEDICKPLNNNNLFTGNSCLSPLRFGLLNAFISAIHLFLDLLSSFIINQFYLIYLLKIIIPIIFTSYFFLFLGPPNLFNNNEFINMVMVWYIFFNILKNLFPIKIIYESFINRFCKKLILKERTNLFGNKHLISLIGNISGSFLPLFFKLFILNDFLLQKVYVFTICFFLILSYYVMINKCNIQDDNNTLQKNNLQEEQENNKKIEENINIIKHFKHCLQNKAFLNLFILFIYESIRGLLWNGMYILFLTKILNLNENFQFFTGILNIIGMTSSFLFTPIWQFFVKKYGNYNIWLFSYFLQIPIGIGVYFILSTDEYFLLQNNTTTQNNLFYNNNDTIKNIYKYLPFYLLLCIFGGSTGFLLNGIKSMVFDYDELITNGKRRETILEMIWSIGPKYINLFSNVMSFALLDYFNNFTNSKLGINDIKNDNNKNEIIYSKDGIHSILIQTCLLPSITSIICFLIMFKFPLNDKLHEKIVNLLNERKLQKDKKLIDPVTMKEIKYLEEKDESDDDIVNNLQNYYLGIEWKIITKYNLFKIYFKIERFIIIVLFCISCIFGYYFILNVIKSNDLIASFYLWISSVLFTISGFYFSRIKISKQLKDL